MLGRFMTSGKNNIVESINCANENEFGHLVYKFFGDIQTVDREKKEIIYNKQIESNPNQAPHVYSYISFDHIHKLRMKYKIICLSFFHHKV